MQDRDKISSKLIASFEEQLAATLTAVSRAEFFRCLDDPSVDRREMLAMMREIFAEIYSYQKRVDEAVFTAVGRFGRLVAEQPLVRSMIAVQIEEVGHGALALHDYIALGGDENEVKRRGASPEAFAIIAVTQRLASAEHPLTHLGFMFFFERFTTMITELVGPLLAKKQYPDDRLEFMRLHAIEDVRHAKMLQDVIIECVSKYEGAEEAIRYGFDCFAAVYPMPLWSAAYERSKKRTST